MSEPHEFTRIEPAPVALTATSRAPGAGRGTRGRALLVAGAMLIGAAGLYLAFGHARAPRPVAAPSPSTPPAAVVPEAPVPATPAAAAPAPERQAVVMSLPATAATAATPATAAPPGPSEERSRAQAALERVIALTTALDTRAVERWGAEDHARAAALRAEGDTAYRNLDYAAAADRYAQAQARLEALDARGREVLAEALARGAAAIEAGEAAAATDAYDLALAVAPDNADAKAGRERAGKVDAVRALLGQAEAHAAAGRWEDARAQWREALALDPDTAAATAGVRRADTALAGTRFTQAMSAGYAALEAGRLDEARTAFERAQAQRPEAAEAREALAQIATRAASERIGTLMREAAAHEQREDWWPAVVRYDEALKIDPTLVAARDGQARAKQRAALDVKLEQMLAHTERLQSPEVRAEAGAVLANARAIAPEPGPRLARQIADLDARSAQAATPIAVTLQSDEKTEVTVQRVGEMGRFRSREVALTPGRYVAVGVRDGYRDVRVEFYVVAGQPAAPVVVNCTERIGFGAR